MHEMNAVICLYVPLIYCNTETSSFPELRTVSLKYWHVNLINRIRTVQSLRVCVSALGIGTGLFKHRRKLHTVDGFLKHTQRGSETSRQPFALQLQRVHSSSTTDSRFAGITMSPETKGLW